MNLPELWHRM